MYINSLISQRFRRRCEQIFDKALNVIKVDSADPAIVKANHIQALEPKTWNIDPEVIFEEEQARINSAIEGNIDDFLKILPGKTIIADAAKVLGMTKDSYINLICKALIEEDTTTQLHRLGKQLEVALLNYLPKRDI